MKLQLPSFFLEEKIRTCVILRKSRLDMFINKRSQNSHFWEFQDSQLWGAICKHSKKNVTINWSYINFYLLAMYLWKTRLCWVYQDGDILILLMYPLGMSLCPNYLGCHLTELPKNHLRVPFPHSNLVRRSLVISSWDMFL